MAACDLDEEPCDDRGFVSPFVQTHVRVYRAGDETLVELWEHPRRSQQRTRFAERIPTRVACRESRTRPLRSTSARISGLNARPCMTAWPRRFDARSPSRGSDRERESSTIRRASRRAFEPVPPPACAQLRRLLPHEETQHAAHHPSEQTLTARAGRPRPRGGGLGAEEQRRRVQVHGVEEHDRRGERAVDHA